MQIYESQLIIPQPTARVFVLGKFILSLFLSSGSTITDNKNTIWDYTKLYGTYDFNLIIGESINNNGLSTESFNKSTSPW